MVGNAGTIDAISRKSFPTENGWEADELCALLDGRWLNAPGQGWVAKDIAISANKSDLQGDNCLFVAIDEETWHKGSGNTGIYSGWPDTHEVLKTAYKQCCGAIVQRPVEGLPDDFPQLVVKNSYDVLHVMAEEARRRMTGKIVAITGTVGKSTTKDMLSMVLGHEGSVVSTRRNHNTRTGTSVTLARCVGNPDFAVLEVALSALWMRNGGVGLRIKPHIGIVTEIGITQVGANVRDEKDTARFKARICNGLAPGGHAILNRDMDEFDLVESEVRNYGAEVLSYGFHPKADIRVLDHRADHQSSDVRLLVGGQEIDYRLHVPGKGMVSNSMAVLTAVKLLGLDVSAAAQRLAEYRSVGKLESKPLPLRHGGQANMIDDNYNAAVESMKAAFEVAALHPVASGARRVAVLGRMVNLGERATELHASLVEPIIAAGFDKVFLHGEEMAAVEERLPEQLSGGLFQDARRLADAAMDYLRDGDMVLVKGSVRGSEFRSMPKLLLEAARPKPEALPTGMAAEMLIDLDTGEVLHAANETRLFSPRHLSQLLLNILCADRLAQGNLSANEAVVIRPISEKTAKGGPIVGLAAGRKMAVSDLIRAMAVWNARDAAVSLAVHLYGSAAATMAKLQEYAGSIGMEHTVLKNVSGRRQAGQGTVLADVARLVQHFWEYYPNRLHWFSVSEATFANKVFRNSSNLLADGRADFSFNSGGSPRWGFAIRRIGGRSFLACTAGANGAFNLDYRLDGLLKIAEAKYLTQADTGQQSVTAPVRKVGRKGKAVQINILGDTYFGEWYSARRQRRGVEDALTRYGYDHSFAALKGMLAEGDFNIVNFEAALSRNRAVELAGRKPFLLTGDPDHSPAALKYAGIHAAALGNNHALDAGLRGLVDTLNSFDEAGIARFGAGRDAAEAEAPLVLQVGDRTFKFFSAYWFRQYMEHDCRFYALPGRGGVACLAGGLLDAIRTEKRQADPATVIVLAHWGSDFTWTSEIQRKLARQLVGAGADVIIGSGPHMLGEFEQIKGRWVVYSIGNGVFNSDGEYQRRGMPPYGFFTRLFIAGDAVKIGLYPILTDNLQTFWQPRLVDAAGFQNVLAVLRERGVRIRDDGAGNAVRWETDEVGRPFIVLPQQEHESTGGSDVERSP